MSASARKSDLTGGDDKSAFRKRAPVLPQHSPHTTSARSAPERVIDPYRVSTDPRSGIVNDPNRERDPQYILRLLGQVITVSLETQHLIASLPSLNLPS